MLPDGEFALSERQQKCRDIEMLTELRGARTLILRDAESFHEASTALEHVGQILAGEVRIGLDAYRKELINLAMTIGTHERSELVQFSM